MARSATRYVCQECGAAQPKWTGKCEACGGWNTLVEEVPTEAAPRGLGRRRGRPLELATLAGPTPPVLRRETGIAEFDRVTGGGLVAGSALLIGGDPGFG